MCANKVSKKVNVENPTTKVSDKVVEEARAMLRASVGSIKGAQINVSKDEIMDSFPIKVSGVVVKKAYPEIVWENEVGTFIQDDECWEELHFKKPLVVTCILGKQLLVEVTFEQLTAIRHLLPGGDYDIDLPEAAFYYPPEYNICFQYQNPTMKARFNRYKRNQVSKATKKSE